MMHLIKMQFLQSRRQIHFNLPVFILQQLSWPLIYLVTLYFTYSPFQGTSGTIAALTGELELWPFLFAGVFIINLFQEYVIIGFSFSFTRDFGMLEIIYLSPANRFIWILGNTTTAFLSAALNFLGFIFISTFLFRIHFPHPILTVGLVIFTIISSLGWGVFISSIFLIGRNARFLYAIFETPAEFFSGLRFPLKILPTALFSITLVYPLRHSIALIRHSLLVEIDIQKLVAEIIFCTVLGILYGIVSIGIIAYAEWRGKERGDLSFS
jgi:ABC-2 type transport system permease protein